MASHRRFNIASVAIVLLAILILIRMATFHGRLSPMAGALGGALAGLSVIVLVITAWAVWINLGSIVDWIRIRIPPVIHDEVLGDLTYRDGRWYARSDLGPAVSVAGRRIGPDAELVSAGSRAWVNATEMEAKARAFAQASGISSDRIGRLVALHPEWVGSKPDRAVNVLLEFELTDDSDVLDVTFRNGEPFDVDIH